MYQQQTINFTQPYYNTIPINGQELETAIVNAESQEEKVEWLFRTFSGMEFTPFAVAEKLGIECINSVRRSITNLTKKGILRKTGNFIEGRFGVKNNCWQLNKKPE